MVTADSKQAVAAMRGVGTAADKDLKKATTGSAQLGDRFLKTGAVLAGAGVAAFAAATVATIRFDKAMSAAGAVAGATGKQLGQLRQAAIQAGADTAFSASEAAQGIEELAKAGVSTRDILGGGLKGALSLAAAGTLDLATASTIAAQAMNIFELSGNQVGHVADVLAAGSNKSAASVQSLGEGLGNVGSLASSAGLSLEETVGTLSAFSDNALNGAEGGNALKSALIAIQRPSAVAAATMKQYGIDLFNAKGEFIGLAGTAGQLKTSLQGLTQEERNAALARIFGSRGLLAANILYKEGAKGINDYTKSVDDQGAAAEVAAAKLDNLAGDLEYLKGSIESALIETGSKGSGGLRLLVQSANAAVDAFTALPGPIQTAASAIAVFGGASLLASGAIIKYSPAIKDAVGGLSDFVTGIGRSAAAATTGKIAYEGFGATLGIANLGFVESSTAQAASTTAMTASAAAAGTAADANVLLSGSLGAESRAAAAAAEANFILGGGLTVQAEAAQAAVASNLELAAAQQGIAASSSSSAGSLAAIGLSATGVIGVLGGVAVGAIAAASAIGLLDDSSTKLATSTDELARTSVRQLAEQMRSLKQELDPGPITATDQAIDSWRVHMKNAGRDVALTSHVMGDFNKVLKDSPQFAALFISAMKDAGLSTAVAEAKFKSYMGEQKKLAPLAQAAAISQAALSDAVDGGTKAFDEFLKPLNAAAELTQKYTDAVKSSYDAEFALTDARRALGDAIAETTDKTRDSAQVLEDQQKAVLGVAEAAGQWAEQQAGPGATAAEKQDASFKAQILSLKGLATQYPKMAPFINGYILKLEQAAAASDSGAVSTEAAIGVLDALKQKYPELIPEIDKLIKKIKESQVATQANDVTNQAAISVLDALKAKYPQLAAEIDHLIGRINAIPVAHNTDVTVTINQGAIAAALSGVQSVIGNFHPVITPLVNKPHVPQYNLFGQPIPGTSKGGKVRQDELRVVGEEGSEVFLPAKLKMPPKGSTAAAMAKASVGEGNAPKGVLLLAAGDHLFTPTEPGTVIPHQKVPEILERLGVDEKQLPRRATGGRLNRGQTSRVGEQNTEVWWPDSAGAQPSAARVPQLVGAVPSFSAPPRAAGAAPVIHHHYETYEVNVQAGFSSKRETENAVMDAITRVKKRNGNLGIGEL